MILSVPELQAALETDLPVPVLQIHLDAAEQDISAVAGPAGAHTERVSGGTRHLFLSRPAASITSVTEYATPGTTPGTVLLGTDYFVRWHGRGLERSNGGRWADQVDVTYTPVDDAARRKQVQLDLVRLAITYRGAVKSETDGTYSASAAVDPLAYERERQAVLRSLRRGDGLVC